MEIRTFIGRKLEYIDGILRRQVELDRYLRELDDVKLTYGFYTKPKNPLDFISKRFVLYPYYSAKLDINSQKEVINHLTFQYLGDLGHYLDPSRTIITCHDVHTFLIRDDLKMPWFLQKYLLSGLKKCKYVIAISNFTKNEMIKKLNFPPEKIVVIKNGINTEMFHPISNEELSEVEPLYPKYDKILHVGSEESRKNFLTLLKAFYLVRKKRKNVKLIRVGSPNYMDVIKSLHLEDYIVYLSNISNRRLLEVYNLCDLLIFPSYYEGWGAPGLEAAACGTPVICSDIQVFKEVYQEFPVYCPSNNYELFAERIIEVLDDKDLQQKMSEKGLKIANEYNWSKSSKKYLKLAKSILKIS